MLVSACLGTWAALPGCLLVWGLGAVCWEQGRSATPSCQPLSPSVGLRGHAAADPGCHGDRLLYPMDAGDSREGRGGSRARPQREPSLWGRGEEGFLHFP